MNKTLFLVGSLAAGIFLTAGGAQAATYDFGYAAQSGFEIATGSFTTNDLGELTSISGQAAGPASSGFGTITGLSTFAGADNLYLSDPLHVDIGGISFSTSNGIDYNLFSRGSSDYVADSAPMDYFAYPVTLDITPVASAAPEPSTWIMLFVGAAMTGAMLRFKTRLNAPALSL